MKGPHVGRAVQFFSPDYDDPIAAMITRVWSSGQVNLRLHPDAHQEFSRNTRTNVKLREFIGDADCFDWIDEPNAVHRAVAKPDGSPVEEQPA